MSYKIDFSAADVQWQIMMLQEFPQIANKHFYPAMRRSVNSIYGAVFPKIPVMMGLARSEFRKAVSGNGMNITGRAGWAFGTKAWYINIQEYGAKAHAMNTYVPRMGVRIKTHPGIPALKFMERGQAQAQSVTEPEMAMAAEAVVNELARK